MVFITVYAVRNIGVKQLRAAIVQKFGSKDVWVMDSIELKRELVLERLAKGHVMFQYKRDEFQEDRDMTKEMFKQKRGMFKHGVYINYTEEPGPDEPGDFECMIAMKFDEQEFRKCYLDMCRDMADIDVSTMKTLLSRIDPDDAETVMWWGDVYNYSYMMTYKQYKAQYMLMIQWFFQLSPGPIMDTDDTIALVVNVLSGVQQAPPPRKFLHDLSADDIEGFFYASPLVDLQWYKDNIGIDPVRIGVRRRQRQKILRKVRRDKEKRRRHRHGSKRHHDKNKKRHRHDNSKKSKGHRHGSKRKKRPKSNRHKRRH